MTAIDSMSKDAFMGYFAMDFEVAEFFDSSAAPGDPFIDTWWGECMFVRCPHQRPCQTRPRPIKL